jgi:hypothetical protein
MWRSNLIERIREFAAAKELSDAVAGASPGDSKGNPFPKPIVRSSALY